MISNSWFGVCMSIVTFGGILVGGSPSAAQSATCPEAAPDQAIIGPLTTDPNFLGMVANELLIPVALDANIAFLAQQYKLAGVGHARVWLNWESIEPNAPVSPGANKFDWGLTDLQVSTIANSGMRTLGIIDHNPAWASFCTQIERPEGPPYYRCLPTNMADYENFVRALVRRYGPGPGRTHPIRDWEIQIENSAKPNDISKQDYVVELNAAYAVIHQEDPGALVWGPEIAFFPGASQNALAHEFAEYAMEHGDLDIFSIHLFPDQSCDYSNFVVGTTKSIRDELNIHNLRGIPLAVTAMAAITDDAHPFPPQTQADNLREMYACARAGGADYAMWFAGTQWDKLTRDIPCDTEYGIFRYVSLATSGPWTCMPATPMPPNPNKVVPKRAYTTLQALGYQLLAHAPDVSEVFPTYAVLGLADNPCRLNSSGQCLTNLYIYSTGVGQPQVGLRRDGGSPLCVAANMKGMVPIAFSSASSSTFELFAADSGCAVSGPRLAVVTASAAN